MDIKNLNDVIVFSQEGLTKNIVFDTPDVLCFVLSLVPGQQIPDHRHEQSDLLLTVLKGKGQARVNGRLVSLALGTILHVEGQEDFAVPVVEEHLSLLATLSPNPENPEYSIEVNA
jgi:quercetin dioxygenase-like cupin family protein